MKLHLDDLERKALERAAISADVDLTDNDVTLALIARIRELEAGLRDAIACHESIREQPLGRSAPWHTLLERGVVLP